MSILLFFLFIFFSFLNVELFKMQTLTLSLKIIDLADKCDLFKIIGLLPVTLLWLLSSPIPAGTQGLPLDLGPGDSDGDGDGDDGDDEDGKCQELTKVRCFGVAEVFSLLFNFLDFLDHRNSRLSNIAAICSRM